MDFIRPSLSRNEAEAVRQSITNNIDYLFSPVTGCPHCRQVGTGGCGYHARLINTLRLLRTRFNFSYIDAPAIEAERVPTWCRG